MVTPVREFLGGLEHLCLNLDIKSGEGDNNRRLAVEDSSQVHIKC